MRRTPLILWAILVGCQLPPSMHGLVPDAVPGREASVDHTPPAPDQHLPGDFGVDPALRDKIFAEVDDYLRAEDPGASPPLLARLDGEYKNVPAALFVEAVRVHRLPIKLPALGLHQGTWTESPPSVTTSGVYHAYVPAALGESSTGDRFPLILFLHGAGGNGAAIAGDATMQAAAGRLGAILVAPTSDSTCDWNADETCMAQTVQLIRVLKRRYPVDDTRVVLTGFSMGGRGSFSLAVAYPDAYCGVVPVASAVGAVYPLTATRAQQKAYCCPHMENLLHLRLHYFAGDQDMAEMLAQNRACAECGKDLGLDFVYTEMPGLGHVFPPDLWEDAVKWTLQKPRARMPSPLVFNIAPQLSPEPPGYIWAQQSLRSPPYWIEISTRTDDGKPARLEARLDGSDVRIKSKNVAKARFRLAAELLPGPTAIRVLRDDDGTVLWQGTLTPDRKLLLEEARRWSERDAVYLGAIDLTL
jgi:predicted esterase